MTADHAGIDAAALGAARPPLTNAQNLAILGDSVAQSFGRARELSEGGRFGGRVAEMGV